MAVALFTGVGIGGAAESTENIGVAQQSAPVTMTVTAPAKTITQTVTAPAQTITQTATASKPAEAPVVAGTRTEFGAGTYEVGTDIKAGKYKTSGPDGSGWVRSCYWARNKDSSGSFDAIIANDNIEGPGTLTVNSGEVLQLSGSCVWKLAG
ncbi:hypothetical protein [Lentzea sp. NBRC 105346]|uniref:hypothetical protein n=1 Tax=Lentzea sp. NBRC 105346 TaxID=3032205 RepID=UPI002554C231|nr:hypothetical protein [Lentzea sp. NBRC 105346]